VSAFRFVFLRLLALYKSSNSSTVVVLPIHKDGVQKNMKERESREEGRMGEG